MKKIALAILTVLCLGFAIDASAGFFTWRYREHATDCTDLTDGKNTDLCYEIDDDTLYKCEPSAGDCDTAGEWKAIGNGGTPGGSATQIQYNNSGSFGGITGSSVSGSSVTFGSIDGTTIGTSSAADATFSSITLNNVTQGVPFSSNGKLISDDDFFYDDSVDELQAGFYTASKATSTLAGFNVGTGAAGVDYRALKVDGQSSDFRMQWLEDEAFLKNTSNLSENDMGFVVGEISPAVLDLIKDLTFGQLGSLSGVSGSLVSSLFSEARSIFAGGASVVLLTNPGSAALSAQPLGKIEFQGNAGSDVLSIGAVIGASADEDWTTTSSPGEIYFGTTPIGTDSAPINRMTIGSEGDVNINDGGYSTADFRVESDNISEMLFVDASEDMVKIGGATTTISSSGTIISAPLAGGGDRFLIVDNNGRFTTSPLNITSGTYTPTLTSVSNVSSSTAYQCQYIRIGSVITVSGKLDIDPTSALSSTKLGIGIPIASNFTATENVGGVGSNTSAQPVPILADTTNDRAQMEYTALDASATTMYFTFTYLVQ